MEKLLSRMAGAFLAAALFTSAALAGDFNRWEGWNVQLAWANPGPTFKYDIDTSPMTSGKMTGSLVGAGIGYGWQFGKIIFGLDAKVYGGVLEAQENGRLASIKGLALGTASIGYALWDKLLVSVGGGPAFALAHVGKMDTGLRYDFLSGAHAVVGVAYAITPHSAIGLQVHRLRLADSYYVTAGKTEGVNFKDSWMGELAFTYHF